MLLVNESSKNKEKIFKKLKTKRGGVDVRVCEGRRMKKRDLTPTREREQKEVCVGMQWYVCVCVVSVCVSKMSPVLLSCHGNNRC